eukprot:42970-Karenia_brevis.AAC.1
MAKLVRMQTEASSVKFSNLEDKVKLIHSGLQQGLDEMSQTLSLQLSKTLQEKIQQLNGSVDERLKVLEDYIKAPAEPHGRMREVEKVASSSDCANSGTSVDKAKQELFPLGSIVVAHSLKTTSLNGQIGYIRTYDEDKQRYGVQFVTDGQRSPPKLLLAANLR